MPSPAAAAPTCRSPSGHHSRLRVRWSLVDGRCGNTAQPILGGFMGTWNSGPFDNENDTEPRAIPPVLHLRDSLRGATDLEGAADG